MVILHKNLKDGIIGTVPLKDRPGGDIIGTAELEKVGSNIIVKIDASDIPEAITKGFGLGSFSIREEPSSNPSSD
jgi:hypothetical protein